MGAFFQEVSTYSGFDDQRTDPKTGLENGKPPGMIVPVPGARLVRLENGQNLQVDFDRPGLTLEKVDNAGLIAQATLISAFFSFGTPDPALILYTIRASTSRFFKISASHTMGKQGVALKAHRPGNTEASIQVVPLNERRVKLAIRPVQVKAANGNLVNHSKKPPDFQAMLNRMNLVWAQSNVVFDLVSTAPAVVDNLAVDLDANTDIASFKELAAKDLPDGLTMFLVSSIFDKVYGHPHGITRASDHFSLISDFTRDDLGGSAEINNTMTHEAGHYMGEIDIALPSHADEKYKLAHPCLMCDWRSLKIPFDQTIDIYNTNY